MAFVPRPSAASRNIRSTTRLSGSWITSASRLVIPKAVRWLHCRDDLALTSLLEFPSPAPLSELCPLVLRELVQHAIRQLALRGIVATVIKGADLRSVLLELPPEEVMIGRLAGEPIAVLCQHHIDTTTRYEVPHPVHVDPLKAGAALSGV